MFDIVCFILEVKVGLSYMYMLLSLLFSVLIQS